MAYMRLGDLLIAAGAITQEQLEEALTIQKQTKERLGDVLIENNIITERQLIEALQMQLGVDFIDLTAISIPLELAKFVPRAIAKKYNVVPVKLVKDELFVAMSDPLNFVAQEEIKAASHKRVVPMISTRRATEQAIGTLYGSEGTARAIEEMKREVGTSTPDIVPVQMNQTDAGNASAAPTIRFVNSVIERAFLERASDIHLEPQEGEMVVRMRIDGILRKILTVPANLQSSRCWRTGPVPPYSAGWHPAGAWGGTGSPPGKTGSHAHSRAALQCWRDPGWHPPWAQQSSLAGQTRSDP